jgi:hypothetical protein
VSVSARGRARRLYYILIITLWAGHGIVVGNTSKLTSMCACVSARGRASLLRAGARRRQLSLFTHCNRLSQSNLQAEPDVVAERQRPSRCDGQARLHAVLHSVDPLAELDSHRRKLGRGVSWPSARDRARAGTPRVGLAARTPGLAFMFA